MENLILSFNVVAPLTKVHNFTEKYVSKIYKNI